ncbi:cation channel sperm-associated auxiliary subunit zeta [Ursus arctos]|uniref:cation channel sperm-associated auxiliary subunit zeta n=1 Tax=Ursus arctos TaxID=9644 RepID=UPI000E6DC106|nr:cation channel sperm-associated auxiliary subunit zeta [Ursus arctos]
MPGPVSPPGGYRHPSGRDSAPPRSWSVTPCSSPRGLWRLGPLGQNHGGKALQTDSTEGRPRRALPLLPNSSRPLASLVVCGPQASLGSHGSDISSPDNDIRNLWTRATLSQPNLNVPRSRVGEDSDMEGSSSGTKSRRWYNQKARRDSDGGWEEWDDGEDKESFRQEDLDEPSLLELELRRAGSLRSRLEEEEDVDSKPDTEISSSESSSLNISKHTPHRAYWMEQQNRLPLPLMELMENEALEILTKALRSYRSGIGRDHFLTKQLHGCIEGLKRRRSKRLNILGH